MRKLIILIVFALMVQACETSTPSTPTEILFPTSTMPPISIATIAQMPTITIIPTKTPFPGKVDRVIIVSFDGLRPDAIAEAPMNNLIHWMRNGAYTLEARTIDPSLTLPGHASMISGICASQHGMYWDTLNLGWGYSKGVDIFDLAHDAGMRTVIIAGKEKIRALAEPETTDVFEVHGADQAIFQGAIDQLSLGFNLMMVHIPSPDARGHKYGWMTNAQFKALRESDVFFGDMITALDELGLSNSTLVIVTADHGGHDRNHDGSQLVDQLIPWAMVGPGVEAERLVNLVSITDTAATAAYALDLPLQPEWVGIPVYEGFDLPSPVIHESVPCKN